MRMCTMEQPQCAMVFGSVQDRPSGDDISIVYASPRVLIVQTIAPCGVLDALVLHASDKERKIGGLKLLRRSALTCGQGCQGLVSLMRTRSLGQISRRSSVMQPIGRAQSMQQRLL